MPQPRFETKICPDCQIEKPRSDYYKKGEYVSYRCKPCTRAQLKRDWPKHRASTKESYKRNKDKYNQTRRERYATDPAYREKIATTKAESYKKRKGDVNQARRARYAADPVYRADTLAHNRRLQKCTPPWVDKRAIAVIYRECPVGHEVDHIIPIKGKIDGREVSGLHVPWNLQYLTTAANRRKYCLVSEKDIAISYQLNEAKCLA